MSIDALSWAFNLDLPSSGSKLTLLALANYSDEYGEAYPSQKAMAKKTCLCERAIRTHLVTLESLGIITRQSRKRENGSYTSDLFKLKIGAKITSGNNCQRQILPTAEKDISQRQILPNPAADSAYPDPSLTTTITKGEPSVTVPPKKSPRKQFFDGVDKQIADDFIAIRRAKKSPVTETAINGIRREAEKLGYSFEQALTICCERGWAGFKADWILKEEAQKPQMIGINKQEALEQSNRAATAGWMPPELRELKNAN